jgi:hypothetical protein
MIDFLPPKFLADADPDAIGEFLRDIFFDQKNGVGCYSTFDVRTDFIKSEPDEQETILGDDYVINWTVYSYAGIKMRYYWDGDGTLEFHLPDGRILENTDCKKDNRWGWFEK